MVTTGKESINIVYIHTYGIQNGFECKNRGGHAFVCLGLSHDKPLMFIPISLLGIKSQQRAKGSKLNA